MKTARAALALGLCLALAAPTFTPHDAHAQQPSKAAQAEAATRFKKGLELFKEGDYQAALIEFRRAYDLAPNFNVLYNIGQVHFQLQDYAGALGALERYLADGGNQVPGARREDVKKDIDKLRSRVANVEITTNVEGAEILVDDVPVGKTPLSKQVLVSAGRRKITATKEGRIPAIKVIEIAGGDSMRVPLDLVEPSPGQPLTPPPAGTGAPPPADTTAPPAPPPTTPPIVPPTPESGSSVPWAGWVLTGAFTAGAVVVGVLALGASNDLKTMRESPGQTRDSLDSQQDKTVTFALVTDILAGAAIIAGGVSLFLTVRGSSSSDSSAASSAPSQVKVGLTPGGVKILGSF